MTEGSEGSVSTGIVPSSGNIFSLLLSPLVEYMAQRDDADGLVLTDTNWGQHLQC